MYTVIKKYSCVPFSELPEPIRAKVFDKLASWHVDNDWYVDELDFFAHDALEMDGILINKNECYFNIDSMSGGFKLEKVENLEALLRILNVSPIAFNYIKENPTFEFRAYTDNYPYQCADVDGLYIDCGLSEEEQDAVFIEVREKWHDYCMEKSAQMVNILRDEYDYRTSEEYVKNYADDMEMIFDIETGEIFYLSDVENN